MQKTRSSFSACLPNVKNEVRSCVLVADVLPETMSKGYESWWRVGVAEVSESTAVQHAHQQMNEKN